MFGLFKVAASVGSFLFGGETKEKTSTSNAMEAAKGIGNWIDEQTYTDEEKSIAHANNTKTLISAVIATQEENSTRSVTRRVLAWAIMGTFLGTFILCVGLTLAKKKELVMEIRLLVDAFSIGDLALAVGSFYFLASLVRSHNKNKQS